MKQLHPRLSLEVSNHIGKIPKDIMVELTSHTGGKDYTHISVILDRAGSMESIREDTIRGFNSFLKAQRVGDGLDHPPPDQAFWKI